MGSTVSDNRIRLVPVDPRYMPNVESQSRAKARFARFAPRAEIEAKNCDRVEFFDCGENFSSVCCPSCKSELSVEWWGDCMANDYNDGFKLAELILPCCNSKCTLDGLVYDWPQAFGKFVLDAVNPGNSRLKDVHRKEIEEILGTKLRVIYQHI